MVDAVLEPPSPQSSALAECPGVLCSLLPTTSGEVRGASQWGQIPEPAAGTGPTHPCRVAVMPGLASTPPTPRICARIDRTSRSAVGTGAVPAAGRGVRCGKRDRGAGSPRAARGAARSGRRGLGPCPTPYSYALTQALPRHQQTRPSGLSDSVDRDAERWLLSPMANSAWTEQRLLRMIEEQIRETSNLDYKRSAALARTDVSKNELSKDVSAFANAGGGTLIYGIAEDAKRHVPERLDEGIDPSVITKEWLDDVISSSIHRKIDGVRIHVVPLTAERAGRVSYVVEIPQSLRAPHMASDHRHYKRYNFKSEPMEEYEVRDVARRGIAPQLRVRSTFGNIKPGNAFSGELPRADLHIGLANHGSEAASVARVELSIDARAAVIGGPTPWRQVPTMAHVSSLGALAAREYAFNWGGPDAFPVFEGSPAHVTTLIVEPLLDAGFGPFLMWWRVLAPKSMPSEGVTWFGWGRPSGAMFAVHDLQEGELPKLADIPWQPTDYDALAAAGKLTILQDVQRYRDLK
jgi:schlafen family protein